MTCGPYILALDQGTTSSRALIFRRDGSVHSTAQQEFDQLYPQPGWVEHDPRVLWESQLRTAREALSRGGLTAADVRAVGITNQRETTLIWNRKTGLPLHNAIVWQDRRTEPQCEVLRQQGLEPRIRALTGLRVDAYFSATKLRWLLDHVEGAQAQAEAGELAFGTVDSWLIWNLTGGKRHVTDISNASRTLLFNIHTAQWDDELLALFRLPRAILPEVLPSQSLFGHVAPGLLDNGRHALPIGGVAGDQQSALLGQLCLQPGDVKNTYGTGCFMLMHTGLTAVASENGLISSFAAQHAPHSPPGYALEGSVFIGGAVVQWLRDGLKVIRSSAEVEVLAASVPDSNGVMLIPAFSGLGAPYWLPDLRGSIQGLTRGSSVAHIARAALESIVIQSTLLLRAMQRDTQHLPGLEVTALRVDGGACANNLLMQLQADMMGIPVLRPQTVETTALGSALLAGLQQGVFGSADDMRQSIAIERVFEPQCSRDHAEQRLDAWDRAVRRSA
ncbi:MAG: glycerol kinase GlpK [Comamonas sp.]